MRCQVSTFGVIHTCASAASTSPGAALAIGLGTVRSLDRRMELLNRESNHKTTGLNAPVRRPLEPTPY
jgi:hypothetical protein